MHKIEVELTDEEFEDFEKCAKFNGVTLTEYCRYRMDLQAGNGGRLTGVWLPGDIVDDDELEFEMSYGGRLSDTIDDFDDGDLL